MSAFHLMCVCHCDALLRYYKYEDIYLTENDDGHDATFCNITICA